MQLADVTLDDKYALPSGRIYVTGTQALVRLPLLQRSRDAAAGLHTGGFISGYRGSPLGGYDLALWQAEKYLKQAGVHFQPGLNEDLAATAVWGSQQVGLGGRSDYDGVFAIWYGKGPGVDRSGDPFKHGNLAGTSPHGGVLVLVGDDHLAKSSTAANQSEPALSAAGIPVLNAASIQEYLDYGVAAIEMSRYAGCWVGMKCLADTVDGAASVVVGPERINIVTPTDFDMPDDGVHIRTAAGGLNAIALDQERRLMDVRLPAAQAFVRANRLDRVTHDLPAAGRRIGIVATGKSWNDVVNALELLGIDDAAREALGLTVYKVAMPWPLEPLGIRAYASGHEQLLVVEEKRPLIEEQLATVLYKLANRPGISGKRDEDDRPLLPAHGELSVEAVAAAIVGRIARLHGDSELVARLMRIVEPSGESVSAGAAPRVPWYCSGCPHNTSTRVPDGSRVFAGIGCHTMAIWMPDRNTESFTHMGGEGAQWIGQAPFSKDEHVFQNLGDGTYFHSGLLAIRAAVASGVNITYKILFNDAVAMTGGQPVEGKQTPWSITRQVDAEGVKRVVVVTDEPDKYPSSTPWARDVAIRHRRDLDAVQRELREIKGTTVLVYDQTCAAEKRRMRKRGTYPDPATRVFINDAVCEGCGDCGVKSNCVAVKPLETEFGRKRIIDQSSCNKDYSCVEGFCPSFVTVHGGEVRKAVKPAATDETEDPEAGLPEPALAGLERDYNILVTGIGGTGVVTIGALLGMAAHLQGKGISVLDKIGLAQKNGAVSSHIRLSSNPEGPKGTRIGRGATDLVLGCDMVVAAGDDALSTYAAGRTRAVINNHVVPLATFTQNPNQSLQDGPLIDEISAVTGRDSAAFVAATRLATALMGDAIYSNPFVLGYAWQQGLVPLSRQAIERAIELNGVAVDANKRAFAWGRRAAHAPDEVDAAARPRDLERTPDIAENLDDIVARRVDHLTAYQNAAYASRYERLVRRVQAAEAQRAPGETALSTAVAYGYAKLLAYKDEYEVARLYARPEFRERLQTQFEGDYTLKLHLAPPLLARRDPVTGHLRKKAFGPWIFKVFGLLARLRFVRGSRLDPFGYTAERKTERRLVHEYEAVVEEVLERLDQAHHAVAVELASIPEQIRGFGHVKESSIRDAKEQETALLARLRGQAAAPLRKVGS